MPFQAKESSIAASPSCSHEYLWWKLEELFVFVWGWVSLWIVCKRAYNSQLGVDWGSQWLTSLTSDKVQAIETHDYRDDLGF